MMGIRGNTYCESAPNQHPGSFSVGLQRIYLLIMNVHLSCAPDGDLFIYMVGLLLFYKVGLHIALICTFERCCY
jgi:hypothetical protein